MMMFLFQQSLKKTGEILESPPETGKTEFLTRYTKGKK